MKCFSDCPPGCARECGYVHQVHVQGYQPRTSRREWLLMLALFVVVVLVSLIPA